MFSIFYTIFGWIVIAFLFIFQAITARLFLIPFSKDKEAASHFACVPFLRGGAKLMGIKVVVEGVENIPKESNFILASNHQSIIDIAIHIISIPRKFSFFAKKELLKVPILGGNVKNMGHFVIDRHNPRIAIKQMDEARKKLESGYNLLVFPEGTRCVDGKLGEFKKGAFMMAVQTGLPIIPAYIDGAWKVAKKTSWTIKPGTITIRIGAPIPVEKVEKRYEKDAASELSQRVRDAVLALGNEA